MPINLLCFAEDNKHMKGPPPHICFSIQMRNAFLISWFGIVDSCILSPRDNSPKHMPSGPSYTNITSLLPCSCGSAILRSWFMSPQILLFPKASRQKPLLLPCHLLYFTFSFSTPKFFFFFFLLIMLNRSDLQFLYTGTKILWLGKVYKIKSAYTEIPCLLKFEVGAIYSWGEIALHNWRK